MKPTTRKKEKYNVYFVVTYHSNEYGSYETERRFAGETYAVSKAQAENNVRFRINGAVPWSIAHDLPGDESVEASYEAVLANEDKGVSV